MTYEEAQQQGLIIGEWYVFKLKDSITSSGRLLKGEHKVRQYIKLEKHSHDDQCVDCFAVRRGEGIPHLIALSTVASIEKAASGSDATQVPTDSQMLDYLSLLGDHGFENLASGIWRIHKEGITLGAGEGIRGAIASAIQAGIGEPPPKVDADDAFAS